MTSFKNLRCEVGDIVVRTKKTLGNAIRYEQYNGAIFEVMSSGSSGRVAYYHGPYGVFSNGWRHATEEEKRNYEQGHKNIYDVEFPGVSDSYEIF